MRPPIHSNFIDGPQYHKVVEEYLDLDHEIPIAIVLRLSEAIAQPPNDEDDARHFGEENDGFEISERCTWALVTRSPVLGVIHVLTGSTKNTRVTLLAVAV